MEAVLERNLAENISRVLYPNDNVSSKQAVTHTGCRAQKDPVAPLTESVRWYQGLHLPRGLMAAMLPRSTCTSPESFLVSALLPLGSCGGGGSAQMCCQGLCVCLAHIHVIAGPWACRQQCHWNPAWQEEQGQAWT